MKVLLLAGTQEARALAHRLDRDGRIELITSLAGATDRAAAIAGEVRRGGFGGAPQQGKYMRDNGIDVVLDATHPFASTIAHRTAMLCTTLGIPRLKLLRPAWEPEAGDEWTCVETLADVPAKLPEGAVAFMATGPKSLGEMAVRSGVTALCRRVDPTEAAFPWPIGHWIVARPPFEQADEEALFAREGVTHLVSKNSGGASGRAKLDAARALNLPVIMVDRPAPPAGPLVPTVDEVFDWIESQ